MLYHLFDWLNIQFEPPGFGVFRYITFRAVLAIIFSLIISLLIGKQVINLLRRKLIGESIRDDGPKSHQAKAGTPTMGGLIIIAAILIPTLLWGDLTNGYVLLVMVSTIWMGIIGFIDDYIKVFKKDKAGLSAKFKIIGQVGLGLIVGITMIVHPDFKGKKGQLFYQGEVRPGETLVNAGFIPGDRIVKINDEEFNRHPSESEFPGFFSYVIERGNKPGNRQILKITVSEEKAVPVAMALFKDFDSEFLTKTNIPFVKSYVFNYARLAFWEEDKGGIGGKIIYVLLVTFIVIAVSNAVNLTDGLDGLAAGTSAVTAGALAVFCYVSGNIIFADYLNIFYIPKSSELVIYCASLVGACVGFLWYNAHPAQVFMGDTGSLTLGGAIAVIAIMVKKELLIPIMCGVFFIESLSVLIQVGWFRYTKNKYGEGRRVFRMAPIHHHYELGGLHEAKIVTRFWIISVALAILAFATLKLR